MKKNFLLSSLLLSVLSIPVMAYDTYYIPEENPIYQFNVLKKGESVVYEGEETTSAFDLKQEDLRQLFYAAEDWAKVLNISSVNKPVLYYINAENEYNASAQSNYVKVSDSIYKKTFVNAVLNNLNVLQNEEKINGLIGIGLGTVKEHPGWADYSGKQALYHDNLPSLYVVMEHEIMHSLGLYSNVKQYKKAQSDAASYFSADVNDPISNYDANLRVYTGDTSQSFDPSKEVKPQNGMAVGKNLAFDIITYPVYFTGENALKTITGKSTLTEAINEIAAKGGLRNYGNVYYNESNPRESNYKIVYGLPINSVDDLTDKDFDLSHIELRNSYMSHQDYRNWLTLMEAELALLQDIGYNIDKSKYFGKSYYLNGNTDTFTNGFTGTEDYAVGIHIYGNNNNITQASNISTAGEGSFGVRIDGENNTYTLQNGNSITSTGDNNIGLGATWGKNHNINIENGSNISASGKDSIAVSFDFGNNLMGAYASQKGSYINYISDEDNKKNTIPEEITQGALVENFNVAGDIEAEQTAVYISDNAWVKNINIQDKANIKGDIQSDWNSLKSGLNSTVMMKNTSGEWVQRDLNNALYTNLNFSGESSVKGDITGENGINNTLIMNNTGTVNLDGETVAVKTLNNSGTLNLSENVKNLGNVVNLEENSLLSTQNDTAQNIKIGQLNSNNANIAIDLGDTFTIDNTPETGKENAKFSLIKADEETLKTLDDTESKDLFTNNTLNLSGSANVYYDGNKYEIKQSDLNKKLLSVYKDTSTTDFELGDASQDSTTGNYIVTENALTKDAGTVKGSEFTISGNDINVNGYNGLIVDGTQNANGTTLKTSIYGADDSNITVQNNGKLTVNSEDKAITLGKTGETAITLDTGNVKLNAYSNEINVKGNIQGNNNANDFVNLSGKSISLNKTDNVTITTEVPNVYLNDVETNTNWVVNNGMLNVKQDSYLSSDGTNSLTFNGCGVNLINDLASDIKLASLTLNDKMEAKIDVDLKNQTADRFVFDNNTDVTTNGNNIEITNVNLLNQNTALTKAKYEIPFASSKYNSENLAGHVTANIDRNILTPIYKYKMTYEDNGTQGNIAINRSNTGGYNDYNPAIYSASVAAQAGGYLNQINSFETAFSNMDMLMAMPQSQRNAMKLRNKYAAEGDGANLMTYNPNQLPQEGKGIWARPYATYEKINMKNGPKVENTSYGSYFGGDSDIVELNKGWDAVFSGYAGYTGSHQHYDGNSIYQNGGQLGATSVFYKNKFFTGLTANVGSSVASASTMYGHDNIVLLTTGVASKTGYNFGFKDDKFIIQPSWLMSYSFVNTFDYTNSAGVRVKSDPLHAIQLVPGLKFIGNTKNGWQPYLGVQMVWNIMDKAKFSANEAALEQISIKPYIQYGIGVQKHVGERLTGYAQSMIRNGGRNGIALTAGFRWKI